MNKINVDIIIPDFVNWMTIDMDGEVVGWEYKPTVNRAWEGWMQGSSIGKIKTLYYDEPPKSWKLELYTWS